ncbi:MAG: CoB--CoM heterodisulfide reductase iron-sulfur subunit B family protein [Armatimonadota bacterium]|nr:CoB--CoM heterodisulfide reductase iron-sulfur subunit B family protein [Armatimonadota bacterium]MDR7426651.1 CoB--CoM heterodisulfide reductase iron-sulfur subunit B family protein [Armatimonadota bacterium]MDR7463660.1 CoB--CoM heterodisulfide reductase iron-sulfur subunit B family protein [Armatimonadota bacterium]MDR7468671.1 CoB--CoM heterodisulfide reductase iron-sulfur subunit B family protein [Armatimonadota bacterium]MDR7473794.1 CoB--CoM heterodisulfide reductase iron-sulfur subun
MRAYSYYPGCSLERMAASYHRSAMETARALGVELRELEDWNCCGATAYFHIDELLATTLSARNLALAEQQGLDVVTPCSGCYKNMYFAREHLRQDPDLAEHVNTALAEDGLQFRGTVHVRHLLEVLVQEVGLTEIRRRVTRPLAGLRVAPYYGCQILRPHKPGAREEAPRFFEDLLTAIGATPVEFPLRDRCCGGSLIVTHRPAALSMVYALLQDAADHDAEVVATACPLCQVNLECYQRQVNRTFGTGFRLPVLYFTQLVGLALGIPPQRLGVGTELVSPAPVLAKVAG